MKRITCMMLILCLMMAARADGEEGGGTEEPAVAAAAAVLIDGASGRMLYGKNPDRLLPMASTTKVMTALLALERCTLTEVVTAGKNASGVPGTSIYLREGERLSMREMLLGLMLRSGNDAAVAIAEHVSGSVEEFAALMNRRAEELGAEAHFVTPNGLDAPGHGITARGLALVAREAMKHEAFRRIVSTQRAVIPWPGNEFDRVLTNKNRLLREYEGATGIKTGFTSRAGQCLVFSAEREGMELIGVVLNCGTWFDSAERMLDWGFARFSPAQAAREGEVMAWARVKGGEQATVPLVAERTVSCAVREGEAWRAEVEVLPAPLSAPVAEGSPAGVVRLVVEGQTVDECPLLTGRDVEKWDLWAALGRLLGLWF